MPANSLTCTATFIQKPPTQFGLTVDKTGSGSVSGAGNYAAGATVTLTATPDVNYTFTGWSPSPCANSFVMPANNLTCTATFTKQEQSSIEVLPSSLTFSQQTPTIDVMVVYTSAAANETPNIENVIKAAIDQANTAYRNSRINQRLNLVHIAQVNYQETSNMDMETDLKRLTTTDDNVMDEIHSLRNTYRADLVSLWRSGNVCRGIAYILGYDGIFSLTYETHGFSVVTRSCGSGLIFAHELGHNMGAVHDSYTVIKHPDYGKGGLHDYSQGYVYLHPTDPSQSWRTVMAYDLECLDKQRRDCSQLPYFSNPDVSYKGIPMGNQLANNAATLNESSTTVASFRGNNQSSKETQTLTITNKGNVTLNVSKIDSNRTWLSVTPTSLSVMPNGSTQIQVTVDYALATLGANNGELTISSNDPINSTLRVAVNIQVTGMGASTIDSANSNVYDTQQGQLRLDVVVPNVTRKRGVDTYRTKLKPITLADKPNALIFELEDAELLDADLPGENAQYDVSTDIVEIPVVNVPDNVGMPQLFKAKLKRLSQYPQRSLFEVIEATPIPVIAVE